MTTSKNYPPVKVVALDFHRTLTRETLLSCPAGDIQNTDEYRQILFSSPTWLRNMLISLHRAGIVVTIASFQEDIYDGLSPHLIHVIQRAEIASYRRFTRKEIEDKFIVLMDDFIGGRRMILRMMDILFCGDSALRKSIIPDENVVLPSDVGAASSGVTFFPKDKVNQLELICNRFNVCRSHVLLVDDNSQNICAADVAGFRVVKVSELTTFSYDFFTKSIQVEPELHRLQQQVRAATNNAEDLMAAT